MTCTCPDCRELALAPVLGPYDAAARPLERDLCAALAARAAGAPGTATIDALRRELDSLRREHGRGPWRFPEDRAPGWR